MKIFAKRNPIEVLSASRVPRQDFFFQEFKMEKREPTKLLSMLKKTRWAFSGTTILTPRKGQRGRLKKVLEKEEEEEEERKDFLTEINPTRVLPALRIPLWELFLQVKIKKNAPVKHLLALRKA